MNIAQSATSPAKKPTVTLPIEWAGDVVELTVSLEAVSADTIILAEEGRNITALCQLIVETVESWNLDWNGEPFPPTMKNLRRIRSLEFLGKVGQAILALRSAGDPTKDLQSPSTSEPAANADHSPAGT